MERLDRALWRVILEDLAAIYPELRHSWQDIAGADHPHMLENLHYLQAHGLIDGNQRPSNFRTGPAVLDYFSICATARGVDFVRADGGLSADLTATPVRLDEESLRLLVEAIAQRLDDEPEASGIIHRLKSLSGETLKALLTELALEATKQGGAQVLVLLQRLLV